MNTPSKTNDDNWPDSNLAFYEAVNLRLEGNQNLSDNNHENNSAIDNNSFEFVLSRINQSIGLNATESMVKHTKKPETSVPINTPKETHHEKDGSKKTP